MRSFKLVSFKNILIVSVLAFVVAVTIPYCSNYAAKSSDNASCENVQNGEGLSDENGVANYEPISLEGSKNPFYIIGRVLYKTKGHLLSSLFVIMFIWLILSLIFYFSEHHAQPKVYKNFSISFLWTFVKSIRDPGEMAPHRPITQAGKIVANVIGFLTIIIIAIPTGILSSGFVKVMDEESQKEEIIINIERVKKSFRWRKKGDLNFMREYKPLDSYMVYNTMSSDEVIKAVKHSPELHLYNLSDAYNVEDEATDRIVVVPCPHNRPYGYCVDRGSKVTIVSTSGSNEPLTSWVAFYIAKIGGFNYVAKEYEKNVDAPISYYKIDDDDIDDNLRLFLDDINQMSLKPNSWVIPMAYCTGAKTREHKFHLVYSYKKGLENYSGADISLKDTVSCERLFEDMNSTMTEKFNTPCDKNKYYEVPGNSIAKRLNCKNVLFFRPEGHVIYFSAEKEEMIKTIADVFNRNLEPDIKKSIPPEMLNKPKEAYGFSGFLEYESKDNK